MEIGKKEKYAYFEKQYYARRLTILIILTIIVILLLSLFIIANYTSVFERSIFNNIASRHNLDLSYSNIYELSSADNKEQGNYIQLTDESNGIYILFRYDEDGSEIFKNIDNGGNNKFYVVNTKRQYSNIIQSEDSILSNIDTEFNNLNKLDIESNRTSIGGGYTISSLDTVMGQHRITYLSNMYTELQNRIKHSDLEPNNDDTIMPVRNWFNYENNPSYMISILKSLVEAEPRENNNTSVKYNGEVKDVTAYIMSAGDETAGIVPEVNVVKDNAKEDIRPQTLEDTLETFVDDIDENIEKYNSTESYSTYNVVILNVENGSGIMNNSTTIGSGSTINGVIIGICNNDTTAINKMNNIINELIYIQHLERTIIL